MNQTFYLFHEEEEEEEKTNLRIVFLQVVIYFMIENKK